MNKFEQETGEHEEHDQRGIEMCDWSYIGCTTEGRNQRRQCTLRCWEYQCGR